MNKEEQPRSRKPLTDREKLWIESFHAHETPSSLRLADDFVNSLKSGDVALEVGCAFGRVAIFLAKSKGVVVTGVDINPAEIDYAVKNSVHPKVNFTEMDGTQLELPDNSFDSVVMLGVAGGVESEIRKKLLDEAFRVVKSGGKVAIAEFKMNLDDPESIKKYKEDMEITGEDGSRIVKRDGKILFIARHFKKEELMEMVKSAGFLSIELREHTVETAGIGDGKMKKRQQFTVWGTKPL